MRTKLIFPVVILIAFSQMCSSIEKINIVCKFTKTDTWNAGLNGKFPTQMIYCNVQTPTKVTQSSAVVSKVDIPRNITKKKILALKAENLTINYIPKNLANFLPGLIHITIKNCSLKQIQQTTLSQYPGLKTLDLSNNLIEVLENDLFQFNKNLVSLTLFDNKIHHVGRNVFYNLNTFTFIGYGCNGIKYSASSEDKTAISVKITESYKKCFDVDYALRDRTIDSRLIEKFQEIKKENENFKANDNKTDKIDTNAVKNAEKTEKNAEKIIDGLNNDVKSAENKLKIAEENLKSSDAKSKTESEKFETEIQKSKTEIQKSKVEIQKMDTKVKNLTQLNEILIKKIGNFSKQQENLNKSLETSNEMLNTFESIAATFQDLINSSQDLDSRGRNFNGRGQDFTSRSQNFNSHSQNLNNTHINDKISNLISEFTLTNSKFTPTNSKDVQHISEILKIFLNVSQKIENLNLENSKLKMIHENLKNTSKVQEKIHAQEIKRLNEIIVNLSHEKHDEPEKSILHGGVDMKLVIVVAVISLILVLSLVIITIVVKRRNEKKIRDESLTANVHYENNNTDDLYMQASAVEAYYQNLRDMNVARESHFM